MFGESNRIREFRKMLNLSQADLGAKIGKDYRTVSGYETGRSPVPEEVLKPLADALQTTPEALFGHAVVAMRDSGAFPDMSWVLKDYDVTTVMDKLVAVLRDDELPLDERVRRSRFFLDELASRAASDPSLTK